MHNIVITILLHFFAMEIKNFQEKKKEIISNKFIKIQYRRTEQSK